VLTHVGLTAFAADGQAKERGIAANKPINKVEVVNRLVSFFNQDANLPTTLK
jgi:hypothetical protein